MDKEKIRISNSLIRQTIWRKIRKTLVINIGIIFFIYTLFALTIMRLIFTPAGVFLVSTPYSSDGYISQETRVHYSYSSNYWSFSGKALASFTYQSRACSGDIVAGPFGKISFDKDVLKINNEPVAKVSQETKESFKDITVLNEQYLVIPDSSCSQLDIDLISKENVIGVEMKKVHLW